MKNMKNRYLIYIRGKHSGGKIWWLEDTETGERKSLQTTEKAKAQEIQLQLNRPKESAAFHVLMARTHLLVGNPENAKRTWQMVMDSIVKKKSGNTQTRWQREMKGKPFDIIRNVIVAETKSDDFERVMDAGGVSTNVYLRRLHNFALDMNWLLAPVIAKRAWPNVKFKEKRAITAEEHYRIIEREGNAERKAFYELCWHVGGAQSDMANLTAEDICWRNRTLSFSRMKTKQNSTLSIGRGLEMLLRKLPSQGKLFPYLSTVRESDRATEFKQRCEGLEIKGVTLHSYRYSWAERAKSAGYPERFAQAALGHGSKAVARAYAKNAKVNLPSLEEYEANRETEMTNRANSEAIALAA